jgi:hypothetical protein
MQSSWVNNINFSLPNSQTIYIGDDNSNTYGGIWFNQSPPTTSNYSLLTAGGTLLLNSPGGVTLRQYNSTFFAGNSVNITATVPFVLSNISTPSTPASGYVDTYAKGDAICQLTSSGVETCGPSVQLQATSPGSQQTGNANISGIYRGSEFVGSFLVSNQHALLSGNAFTFSNNAVNAGVQMNIATNNTAAFLGFSGGDNATITSNALAVDGAITYNVNSPPANSVVCYKTNGLMGWASNTAGVIGTTCN